MPYIVDYLENSRHWHAGSFVAHTHYPIYWWLCGALGGLALWWLCFRLIPTKYEAFKHKRTLRTPTSRRSKSDIDDIERHLPKTKKVYDPTRYFKKNKIFLGLDVAGKPIYEDVPPFDDHPHVQLMGTTGCGKGTTAQILIAQAIRQGDAIFIIDPKEDRYMPQVVASEANRQGVASFFVDLKKQVPQIALLAGGTEADLEALLIAGLKLNDTGNESDHYRRMERQVVRQLVGHVKSYAEAPTISELAEAAQILSQDRKNFSDDDEQKTAKSLARVLQEASHGGTLSATDAIDLNEIVESGSALYVFGGSDDERLTVMQRMLVIRIQQIAAKAGRHQDSTSRKILLFLDEAKDSLSAPALGALAKSRDKGLRLIIAHQTISDFEQIAGLNAKSALASVVENCRWKFQFGVFNPDTADWLARSSGTVLIDDEVRNVALSGSLVERSTGQRSLRIGERYRIDQNMWLALANRKFTCALTAGKHDMEFSYLSPVPFTHRDLAMFNGKGRSSGSSACRPAQNTTKSMELTDVDF
nr:type IV secretion system DNA-binding domain-containing protein [Pseudovibrio flavus]